MTAKERADIKSLRSQLHLCRQ